ncbi:MAG: aldo/keto reductase [Alphaproteobacteria bacterium]|nr:aldo/keto reductase [Alphaproteobacteria bacterium]
MKSRRFGRMGWSVSELVIGGGIVGGILILKDEATRRAALERATAAGINWIDTAASYGNGVSEETIGRLRPDLSPRPMISTKFRLAPGDLGDIPAAIERALAASLQRLRIDRIELYQLHNALGETAAEGRLAPEHVFGPRGVVETLERLKEQGVIKAIGFTAVGESRACLRAVESGRFDSAQVYYNILNPSAAWERAPADWPAQDFSGLLAACARHGVAAMNIRVFAGGALTGAMRHGREVAITDGAEPERELARADAVHRALGDSHGSRAQTALRFALAEPRLACIVVGLHELAHLDAALAAQAAGPLPESALSRLPALWARDFRD